MKILRNYVLGELAFFFLSSLAVMTFLLVAGSVLTKMADLVINWGVDSVLLIRLLVYSTPFLFNFTIPMSFLVAIMFTFGKMSSDRELMAVRASGISLWRLSRPVILAAVVLALVSFLTNDKIASSSHFRVRQISAEIGLRSPAAVLEEGVFIKEFKNLVIYIHKIRQNKLEGIRIYQPQNSGPTRTIIAEHGKILTDPGQSMVKLILINGTTDEGDPKDPKRFYKSRFETLELPLDLSSYRFREPLAKKPKEMTLIELRRDYRRLKNQHQFVSYELLTEIHRKIAMSLAVVVFTLIGIPLAVMARRGEKTIGFAIALILSALYWTLLMGASGVAQAGKVPPGLVMQVPNILFVLIAGLFYIKASKV